MVISHHNFEFGGAEDGGEEAAYVLPVGRRDHEHVLVVHPAGPFIYDVCILLRFFCPYTGWSEKRTQVARIFQVEETLETFGPLF